MSDDEERALERAASVGGRPERLALYRFRARKGDESVQWRTADGRLLSPAEMEDNHLIAVVKLKVRRMVLARAGQRVHDLGDEAADQLLAEFLAINEPWTFELEARGNGFKPEAFLRDRCAGWCEGCPPKSPYRRKRSTVPVGATMVYTCENCASRAARKASMEKNV